ncbi:uncharacterized protein LOC132941445 [Metopolophium dirhodum]|uniref:uncharacterized protein LOC132941445 n=1 Tax=Metopolophium dirhodum TaxID=44670 RepID=UPI0029905659|nr:uncharacterized protein LOC132941445 [Metopolophium dirhodum]
MRGNNISVKKNLTLGSNVWVNTHFKNKVQYRHIITEKFHKKLKLLQQSNNELVSRINIMATNARDWQDVNFKYLALQEKVIETETQLLLNGIDTSEYSAFYEEPVVKEAVVEEAVVKEAVVKEDRDSDVEIIDDLKCELLLKCEMNPENCIPIDGQDFIDTSECSAFYEEPVVKEAVVKEDRDSDVEIIDDLECELFLKCEMNPENCIPIDGQDFIDTSECSAFYEEPVVKEAVVKEDRDSDVEIIDDLKCEFYLKCEMNPENCIPIDGQDFDNTAICFTKDQLLDGNYECSDDESS